MPNLKIYLDAAAGPATAARVAEVMEPLRQLICREFSVPPEACQFAMVTVIGLPGQAPVNVEIQFLPRPDRTRARVTEVCALIHDLIAPAAARPTAVRAMALDPDNYISLK